MSSQITAVIMTKNEEKVIARTVRSLSIFDQVLVVDSASDDATVAEAKAAGAEVLQFVWNGRYPKKKQWSLESSEVRNDWVLFVDADEIGTDELAREILKVDFERTRYAAYDINLSYVFLGRRLRFGHKVKKRALLDRNRCRFPEIDDLDVKNMWEVEGHYQPQVDGTVGRFRGVIRHDDVDGLFDYFARHNRYSDWEAHLESNAGMSGAVAKFRSRQGQVFATLPFKPILFALYCYILRLGFLDGRAGFHYCVAQLFYYWQIGIKVEELENARAATSSSIRS